MTDEVSLADLPTKLAEMLGIDVFSAQILASILFLCLAVIPVLVLAKGKEKTAIMVGIAVLGFTAALGWTPSFIMVVIVLITAIMLSDKIKGIFS